MSSAAKSIEGWGTKMLIKKLKAAREKGDSLISVILGPNTTTAITLSRLDKKISEACGIKNKRHMKSVMAAITSVKQKLNSWSQALLPNGLVVYAGTIITEDGNEEDLAILLEPFRPINASLYHRGNTFNTKALEGLLEADESYGFILIDAEGTLFARLSGTRFESIHQYSVDMPIKNMRGGLSTARIGQLRMEKRKEHMKRTEDCATDFFLDPVTHQPKVSGLILARFHKGPDTEQEKSLALHPRLQAKILKEVTVNCSGEVGLLEAVLFSSDVLSNVRYVQEMSLIGNYFSEFYTGKYVVGVDQTIEALEKNAVKILILWEDLDVSRFTLTKAGTDEPVIKHLKKTEENIRDEITSAELVVQEELPLLEWIAREHQRFNCSIEYVTDVTKGGWQFCKDGGIGGIGGITRYKYTLDDDDD